MKRVVSGSLNLVVIASFLPCFAMEKEKTQLTIQYNKNSIKQKQNEKNRLTELLLLGANKDSYKDVVRALKNNINFYLHINPNAQDNYGNVALHYAMRNSNYGMINFLFRKNANPFIENIYHNSPLLYLSIKMPPFELMSIVTDITQKGIIQQMRNDLIEKEKSIDIEKDDDLPFLFEEKIGKQTKYAVDFYTQFLRQVNSFILLSLDERIEKTASTFLTLDENTEKKDSKIKLDLSLPYFYIDKAEEKCNQLLLILKIMNNIAHNFFKKQLILPNDIYHKGFGKLKVLKKDPKTLKIYNYLFKVKVIIDNPSNYRAEINQKIRSIHSDHSAEKAKSSASFSSLAALVEKYFYFPTTDSNYEKIATYIEIAPPSKISNEWFALAINTFAQSRESKPVKKNFFLHRNTL